MTSLPEDFHWPPERLRPQPAIETLRATAGILPELAALSKKFSQGPRRERIRQNMADDGLEILTNPDIIMPVSDHPQTR